MLLCAVVVLVFTQNHKNRVNYNGLSEGVYYIEAVPKPDTVFFIEEHQNVAQNDVVRQGKDKGLEHAFSGTCKAGNKTYSIIHFKKPDLHA